MFYRLGVFAWTGMSIAIPSPARIACIHSMLVSSKIKLNYLETLMFKKSYIVSIFAAFVAFPAMLLADSPADLTDPEIAHVAYTADNIDIRYAHLALAISNNPRVREFAETMIRDHTIVNERALALLKKLNVTPQDNFLSQQLMANSKNIVAEMSKLSGPEFDRFYSDNELAYHKAVNNLVEGTFIPNVENAELKALLNEALVIFKSHQHSAHETVVVVTQ